LNDIKLILNDNLRVKSTVRGEDQVDVGLFRILKIKIKDDGKMMAIHNGCVVTISL